MPDAPNSNRRMVIASLPEDRLDPSNFTMEEGPVPEPREGQVLCRTLAITIGAGQRAGLQGSASYAGAPEAGRVMGGSGIATVEASNDPRFAVGDVVRAPTGWQDYATPSADECLAVDPGADPGDLLGALGTNGLTAYFGLLEVGQPAEGETVLVSAAAGSVGHIVGQIAAIKGASVVGIAGTDEKCALLTDQPARPRNRPSTARSMTFDRPSGPPLRTGSTSTSTTSVGRSWKVPCFV